MGRPPDVIRYRAARASDVTFIIKTWTDSYKSAHGAGILSIPEVAVPCECGRPIRYDFAAVMEVTLARLLQRPGLSTLVAYDPHEREPNDLYGYLVHEKGANLPTWVRSPSNGYQLQIVAADVPMVHFVFIKSMFRGRRIASELFRLAGIDPSQPFLYTCRTSNVSKLEKAGLIPQSRWFPLSVRFPKAPCAENREKSP